MIDPSTAKVPDLDAEEGPGEEGPAKRVRIR
jgi:hypothetical protein